MPHITETNISTEPLHVRKLRTSEDESFQAERKRLDAADEYAREILITGALIQTEVEGARLDEALEDLAGPQCDCDRTAAPSREQWAYYIGLCVGLRLQAASGKMVR